MGYFEFRDKVCRACDSEYFRTINHKVEHVCFSFGVKLAGYAPCLVSFFIVLYAALALGIFTATLNSDLYYQWIEVGSRLIEERQFIQDYHSFSLSRDEYMIATGQGSNPELMTTDVYTQFFDLVQDVIAINVSDPTDPEFSELGWYELCSRTPMPPNLYGPMRFFGGKGLPCTTYNGYDCFVQGAFDYDIPEQLRGTVVPYKYPSEPDYNALSLEERWEKMSGHFNGTDTGSSCTNWASAPIPQNFMFGAVQHLSNGTVDGVDSLQLVMVVKTETQLAQWKCVERCVQNQQCLTKMQTCALACTTTDAAQYAANCSAQLQANATLDNLLQTAYFAYCIYGNSSTCPPELVAAGGTCGSCYNEPNPLNATSAECQACEQALVKATSLPLTNTTLHDFITACLTPYVEVCLKDPTYGCFALGSACEYNCTQLPDCLNPATNETDAALTVLLNWEQNFLNYMTDISNNYPFKIGYFAERSTDDLVNEAGQVDPILIISGYFAMIAFGCITLVRYDALQSRLALGLGGMFLVILSIVGAMGFSALIGITYVPTIVQVLPFLALGLGTYDMFILAFAFRYIPGETVPGMIGELMKECGPRILLTALTNIIVFGIGASIPLRAVSLFSAAMCVVIFFNFLILVIAFTGLISLHAERIHRDKVDCLCCMPAPGKHTQISAHHDDHLGVIPITFAKVAFWGPTKILCLLGACVLFALGIWGAFQIQIGLPLSDIVPKSTPAYGFLSAREESYGSYPSYLFIRLNVNMTDPNVINEILIVQDQLQLVGGMDETTPIAATSWLNHFLWYCYSTPGCAQNGTHPPTTISRTLSDGTVQTTNDFWPDPAAFYYWLHLYFTTTSDGPYYQAYVNFNPDGTILTSRISMIQSNLDTDGQIVNFIKDTRKVTDASWVPCFPGGFLYNLYEQYVNVQYLLTSNLGYTVIGVVGVSAFFLLHPAAVMINICMIALVLSECYGFLALFGLKLNGVSVVNLILAIGLIVVPTEHITRVFMITKGTTTDRARMSLAKMTFPMTFSTISTFLGELPMEFAKFPYFRLYFFYQYVIIGLLTLFNSFLALPYLLEYFGPPPIVGHVNKDSRSDTGYSQAPVNIEMPTLEDTRQEDY